MVRVRFSDSVAERDAIKFLIGRYSFSTFADGLTLVSPAALSQLASAGFGFSVEGKVGYSEIVSRLHRSVSKADIVNSVLDRGAKKLT